MEIKQIPLAGSTVSAQCIICHKTRFACLPKKKPEANLKWNCQSRWNGWVTRAKKICQKIFITLKSWSQGNNDTSINLFVKLFKLELILTKFEGFPPGLIPIEIYGLTDCYLEKRAGNYYYTLCPRPLMDMIEMAAWTYLAPASRLRPWNWISWVPTNHRYIGWCSGTNM